MHYQGQRFLHLPESSIQSPASKSTEARCLNKSLPQKCHEQDQFRGYTSFLAISSWVSASLASSAGTSGVRSPLSSPQTSWLFPIHQWSLPGTHLKAISLLIKGTPLHSAGTSCLDIAADFISRKGALWSTNTLNKQRWVESRMLVPSRVRVSPLSLCALPQPWDRKGKSRERFHVLTLSVPHVPFAYFWGSSPNSRSRGQPFKIQYRPKLRPVENCRCGLWFFKLMNGFCYWLLPNSAYFLRIIKNGY